MNQIPDKSLFSVNDKPGEYEVTFAVNGWITRIIKADSVEDAKKQANALIEDDDQFGLELDDFDEIRAKTPQRPAPMYRVLRNGHPMQVPHLAAGDLPREPDERGF